MKNIFKTFLMLFVINYFANNLLAQVSYLSFSAGYGLKTSSSSSILENSEVNNNSSTYEQINLSFGKGLNIGGYWGYMFNKNFGNELGISYLHGGKYNSKYKSINNETNRSFSSKMLRINPSIIIASGQKKANPYAKFGLIIGYGFINYNQENIYNGEISREFKWKFSGGIALGFSSGIGSLFNLNNKLSLFSEFNMINLSYAPTKGKLTKSTYKGKDELPDLTTSEKEIEFVNSYTSIKNNPPADSKPSKALKQKYPFGSIGLNIGLKINL